MKKPVLTSIHLFVGILFIALGLPDISWGQTFTDTFDRADSTNIGPDWNEYASDLAIISNQVRNLNSGPKAAQFLKSIGPDQIVSADCGVLAASNSCAVMARWSDQSNFYMARLDVGAQNIALFKVVNGALTLLGDVAPRIMSYNTYYRLRLVVSGGLISVFFGDEDNVAISVTDPSLTAGNYAGILASASAANTILFDNFAVAIPLADSFDRSDGTNLGSNWNEYGPELEIFNNQIRNTDSGLKVAQFTKPIGPDQNVSVDCKVTASSNSCAVMARWSSTNNFYTARLDVGAGNIALLKMVNGVSTPIGTAATRTLTAGTYYRIRLVIRGSALSVYFAGEATAAISTTDVTLTTGDYAGILAVTSAANTAWFDNFSASVPYPLNDTFDRPDSSSLGVNWDEYLPDLEIVNNQIRNVDINGKAARFRRSIGPNQDVAVDCGVIAASNSCAVIARWSNSSNFYTARLDVGAGNIALLKVVNGVVSPVGAVAARSLSYSTYYRLRLVINGSSLSVFFANEATPAISVVDTSLSAGDYAGILSVAAAANTTYFNNFNLGIPLPAPTNLIAVDTASDQGGAIGLSWTSSQSAGITEQHIYRATTSSGSYSLIATIPNNTTSSYSDVGLTNGTAYYYVVRAYGPYESVNSNEAHANPVDNIAPNVPMSLHATDVSPDSGGALQLTWTPSVDSDVTQQRLYRSVVAGGPYSTLVATLTNNTTSSYIDSGLINGTAYYYVIRAYDGTSESANSVETSAIALDNSAAITGRATKTDGSALSGAAATLYQGGIVKGSATSGADGSYTFSNLIAGSYELTCSITGYLSQRTSVDAPAGQTTTANCQLQDANGIATFNYDETGAAFGMGLGRLTSVIDPTGNKVTYQYNERGRAIGETRIIDGVTYNFSSTYDSLNRIDTITYPDDSQVRYRYLNNGLLEKVDDPKAASGTPPYAQYSGYNALGQPSLLTFGNGVTTAYTYQPNNFRLGSIFTQHPTTNQCFQSMAYAYDFKGNITTINDYRNASGICGTAPVSQAFEYDHLSRLKTALGPYGTSGTAKLIYDYSEIGNINSVKNCAPDGTSCSESVYAYQPSGPASQQPHAVTQVGNQNYQYDKNGSMTTGAGRGITYNQENKPDTITMASSSVIQFTYDAGGNRIKKFLQKDTSQETTTYVSSMYECKQATSTVGTSCSKYITAGGRLIAMKDSQSTIYFHPDHLGSTNIITDSQRDSGGLIQIKQKLNYFPFGTTRSDSTDPLGGTRYKYTGQELDSETADAGGNALYNYGARLYDPALGRFIMADPLVPRPGNPQSFNRYSYVRNNPINMIDPTGYAECSACITTSTTNNGGTTSVNTIPQGGLAPGLNTIVIRPYTVCGYQVDSYSCSRIGTNTYAFQSVGSINGTPIWTYDAIVTMPIQRAEYGADLRAFLEREAVYARGFAASMASESRFRAGALPMPNFPEPPQAQDSILASPDFPLPPGETSSSPASRSGLSGMYAENASDYTRIEVMGGKNNGSVFNVSGGAPSADSLSESWGQIPSIKISIGFTVCVFHFCGNPFTGEITASTDILSASAQVRVGLDVVPAWSVSGSVPSGISRVDFVGGVDNAGVSFGVQTGWPSTVPITTSIACPGLASLNPC